MKTIRRLLSQLPLLILWLMASVFFWGWIFSLITDPAPARKVTLFADAAMRQETELAAYLEDALPENLTMVQAHPFTYAMLNGDRLREADIYIVPLSHAEEYREWFAPLPRELSGREGALILDGAACGLPVSGAGAGYIDYDETLGEYYLFFGVNSLHTGEADSAALAIAERFLAQEPY